MSTQTLTRPVTLDEATRFIWAEADMLDRLDYKPWLALWTKAGTYTIPVEHDAGDYENQLNVLHDDAAMREMRVKRLVSGFSMSSAPPARTVRTVSRFVVTGQGEGTLALRAAMVLVEYKYERTRVLGADVDYHLAREGDELRLDRKIVRLLNCDDYLHGIGYLL
ncbi:MAG TPA: aromatic-ring-hydroxylating dioxygenase subunit beta [Novosphingobium sp.]|nr:aromatic-ring-hydroxylating dioxygenase subunit beta [Novosphingobium sp.]